MNPEEQRTGALRLANEVRSSNSRLRKEIFALEHLEGLGRVADLLDDPAPPVASLSVGRLLRYARRIGDAKVRRLLAVARVSSEDRRVGELTGRQRDVLAALLRADAQRALRRGATR